MTQSWPFDHLTPLKYGAILADPPWAFENWSENGTAKAPSQHYETMPTAEIAAMPVHYLAAPGCVLFMWATWPNLTDAMLVMRAWGFEYKTGGAWTKRTTTGKLGFGTGYILRSACEPFLIGVLGKPPYSGEQAKIRNVIDAKTRGHSRKPDDAHRILERMVPDAWRLELFARQRRPGWEVWGNEVDKFKAEADPPAKDPALADPRPAAAQGLAPRRAKPVQPQPLGRLDRAEAAGETAEAR